MQTSHFHIWENVAYQSKGWFLDVSVNQSVSKLSVNRNSLVKLVHVSEQNLTGCQLTER